MSAEPFQFRFQKVLDLREQQQRGLEIELGRLDGELLRAREEAARWDEERAQSLQALAHARQAGDLDEEARNSGYLKHVRVRIERTGEVLEQVRQERETARERLERVMQACKMLENYRDRLRGEFLTEQERAEERVVELHSMHKFRQVKRAQ